MSRYTPARHYVSFGIVALALAGFSGWLGLSWTPAFCPAALFFLTATMLLALAFLFLGIVLLLLSERRRVAAQVAAAPILPEVQTATVAVPGSDNGEKTK